MPRRYLEKRFNKSFSARGSKAAAFRVPIVGPATHYRKLLSDRFGIAVERPVAKHRDPADRSVFICFTNRSGSSLLAELLDHCGVTPKAREFFNHPTIKSFANKEGISTFNEYCEKLIAAQSVSGLFASKLGLGQLMFLSSAGFLGEVFVNPLFIYVKRNDLLEQAISFTIADQTKAWTSEQPARREPTYNRAEIGMRVMLLSLVNARFEEFFAINAIHPHRVVFEDFLAEPQRTIDIIADWLGEKSGQFSADAIRLRRQSSPRNLEWKERFLNDDADH